MATWLKWVPVFLLVVLKPRARLWGLLFLGISVLLSLATLPETVAQLEALFGFGRRPIRLDYIVFLWALVPVLWRRPDPFAWLRPSWYRSKLAELRAERRSRARVARGWVGLPYGSPGDRRRAGGATPPPLSAIGRNDAVSRAESVEPEPAEIARPT
jgi:hypothetical protein